MCDPATKSDLRTVAKPGVIVRSAVRPLRYPPAAAVADASAMIAEGVQGGSNNAATDEEKEQVLQISAHEADLIERRI